MRMIGHLDSGVKARSFGDYLTMKGIENQVESEKDGTWAVWILSEEQLQWAKDLFALYQQTRRTRISRRRRAHWRTCGSKSGRSRRNTSES